MKLKEATKFHRTICKLCNHFKYNESLMIMLVEYAVILHIRNMYLLYYAIFVFVVLYNFLLLI